MYNISPYLKLNAVQNTIHNGESLRRTAQKFNVHYQSVYKWRKQYTQGGEMALLSRHPWNRTRRDLEEKVILLKENKPQMTIRRAQEILEKNGTKISLKGIWNIWKRYGFAGFNKENMTNSFTEYGSWSKQAESKFKQAKHLFKRGLIKESAKLVNSIPFLPKNELILEIPDAYLNVRRRVEKMFSLFGKIPLTNYLTKTGDLYNECIKQNLRYSALRIGILELIALSWRGEPEKQLSKAAELKEILIKRRDYYSYLLFEPWFSLLISEGIAYAKISEMKKALQTARTCSKFLKRRTCPSPHFMKDIGILYQSLEDYKSAEYWFSKSLNRMDQESNKKVRGKLAQILLLQDKQKEAILFSKNAEFGEWCSFSFKLLFRANLFLLKGKPQRAIHIATNALSQLRKEEIPSGIFNAAFTIASSYCSIDERDKAKKILQRALPVLLKNKLKKRAAIIKILINQSKIRSSTENLSPIVQLARSMKDWKYYKSLSYAKKKGILTPFYKLLFFFPDSVTTLIEKGKPTALPKAILKLPLFSKEIPVYNIKFLGDLIVYKNRKHLKIKLSPKDTAFLIHFSLRAGEPDKGIPLAELYNNFWGNSPNPSRNLSHLVARIKKILRIPSHLLEISYKVKNHALVNSGIYFTNDYSEFEQIVTQATSLLRAGEWELAKNEFLRGFRILRGAPFKKMYDNWSEDMRNVILNRIEAARANFVASCFDYEGKQSQMTIREVNRVLAQILNVTSIVSPSHFSQDFI